jgi:hypothetical protein
MGEVGPQVGGDMEHIGKDDFQAFLLSSPNRALHAKVTNHLLAGCGLCLEEAREAIEVAGLARIRSTSHIIPVTLRESALLREERKRAIISWAKLAPLDEQERVRVMEARWRYRKHGLATHVLDEAELAAKRNPERAREFVNFSAAVTDMLPTKIYGDPLIADLRLRQEVVLCNISRLCLDFIGALEALQRAEKLRNCGIELAEKARYYRVKGMLLFDLGDFEEGAKAAKERRRLHEEMGDVHSKGKALLQEALILAQIDPATGLGCANEGLAILNPADSYPYISGLYNKAYCLIQLGRADDAREVLSTHGEIIRAVADTGTELSFQALDALILKARREIRAAEEMFSYLAHRFREEGMYREMLLSHLERIRIKAETGRWKSAVTIATRLTAELAKLGLRNDLLGMWASLQDALLQRRDIVSEIENLFRRRWNVPGLLANR